MSTDKAPRRSLSLKYAFTGNKSRGAGQARESGLAQRPSKPTLVQFHVTNEDIVRNTTVSGPAPQQAGRRGTWPTSGKPKNPGVYSFNVAPTLVATPWEWDRSKRSRPQTSDRRTQKSCRFHELPKGVVVCILDHLRSLHCSASKINLKSYQTDLQALCRLNKHWHRLAQERFYGEIWVPRHEEQHKSVLSFRKQHSRLQLLLRTLTESAYIAGLVNTIRITVELADDLEFESLPNRQVPRDSSTQMLRGLILLCRNLEQICGYAPMTLESNEALLDALASCQALRSHTWRIPAAESRPYSIDISRFHKSSNFNPLKTLLICQPINGCGAGIGTISAVIQRLPFLKHLALQGLSPSDFHNGTLLSLPALESLRLEDLHGVTDQGIEQLANARLATSLGRLVLVGLELTSLQTLQTLLTNLTRLYSFSLSQKTSPEISHVLSATASYTNFSLKSASIAYLHWDVLAPGSSIVTLANSIAAGKFPRLRKVKIPGDDDGVVQGLCRPIALQPINDDDRTTLEEWRKSSNYQRSLRVSQIQAQLRVRRERKQPSLKVVIQDDDEATKQTHVIGSYLGNVASSIEYSLEEAIQRSGSAIVRIDDVLIPHLSARYSKLQRGDEYILDLDDLF